MILYACMHDLTHMYMVSMTSHHRHLGENVLGLKTLVDEVYKHIHQKVNREDIKKLISAK